MILTYNIGIQLLHPNARIPEKVHETDAAYDAWATSIEYLDNSKWIGCRIKYNLGFALDLPKGTKLHLSPRSSINKTGLILSNSIGKGDEGYIGEYAVIFYHVAKWLEPYKVGDRIIQLDLEDRSNINWVPIDKIPDKDRGNNGWGSSGLKDI